MLRRFLVPGALSLLLFALSACGLSMSTSPLHPAGGLDAPQASPTEPGLLAPRPHAYAALGASETYGTGARPHTAGYAYLVAHSLHADPFVDEGIPGTTLSAGYDTELTNALAVRPHLVTVFFGFNDIRSGVTRGVFLRDLRDLAVSLRRARAQVLIIGLPDLSVLPAVKRAQIGGVHAIVTSWNAGMAKVARQTGCRFLNLTAFTRILKAHPEYVSVDGLHPANAGYRALAKVVLAAIRKDRLWTAR